MLCVTQQSVPGEALLSTYSGGARPEQWRSPGDCFVVTAAGDVSLAEFVFAFYTSPVFRLERLILGLVARSPSTDAEVRLLAEGSGRSFAVWRVGERTDSQLLMCDRYERTRSWFRVVPSGDGKTLLQFGSAVASASADPARRKGGIAFRLLLKFHVAYSQLLLHAAKRGVAKRGAMSNQ